MKGELLEKELVTLIEYVKQAAGFMEAQAPLLVQEILRYAFVRHITMGTLSLLFVCGVLSLTYWLYRNHQKVCGNEELSWKKRERYEAPLIIMTIVSVITTLLGGLNTVYHYLGAIKTVMAPRVYILIELRNMIGSE